MSISKRTQKSVILATILGSILEWYDIFLFIYWTPVISLYFFDSASPFIAALCTLILNAIGFLSRPLGGLVFGHIGDIYGRRTAFFWSILIMCVPSFLMGIIPSYKEWGIISPILLLILRLFQGLPAGGELPGAMCYLSECASPERKNYMTSFTFYGVQIGVILAILEYLIIGHDYPSDSWVWKLSFMVGGVLGLFGFYLRYKLKETPLFHRLETESKIVHKPIIQSFLNYKVQILKGIACTLLATVGFFAISVFPGMYLDQILGIDTKSNSIIIVFLLLISTVTLPYFGKLGDRFGAKKSLITSSFLILLFSPIFHYILVHKSLGFVITAEVLLVLLLNTQFALLPSILSALFPTGVRYTCLGLSFNITDSFFGGLTPVITLYLFGRSQSPQSFVILIGVAAAISLSTLLTTRE